MALLIILSILALLSIPVTVLMALSSDSMKWMDYLVEIIVAESLIGAIAGITAFVMWI